jgi:hypothetical protein
VCVTVLPGTGERLWAAGIALAREIQHGLVLRHLEDSGKGIHLTHSFESAAWFGDSVSNPWSL